MTTVTKIKSAKKTSAEGERLQELLKKGSSIIVNEINLARQEWNETRWDAEKAQAHLEKGSFFTLTRAEFDVWNKMTDKPKNLHAYLGIFGNTLKFIVTDSITDSKDFDVKSLPHTFIRDYRKDYDINDIDFLTSQVDGNIKVEDALKRVMRWGIMMESWIKEQVSHPKHDKSGMVRRFKIPFQDLVDSFSNEGVTEIILTMAIKPTDNVMQADLILWSTGKGLLPVQNLIKPCPPYCDLPTWP